MMAEIKCFKLQVASVRMMCGMKIIFMFSCRDMIVLVDAANIFVNIYIFYLPVYINSIIYIQ